jgi:predicted nicotinamide N-methyase
MSGAADFIVAHTVWQRHAMVPEIELALASEITPIWHATEEWLAQTGTKPPFWAFAWPGSVAMARHILDHPALVAGRRVLDFAAGCGLAGIAAARAGAVVEAADIDPLAVAAIALNAARNGVAIKVFCGDIVGGPNRWDLILGADICYEAEMTNHILPWLRRLADEAEVWVADPGRAYVPRQGLREFAVYDVPTSRELEDHDIRTTRLTLLQAAEG